MLKEIQSTKSNTKTALEIKLDRLSDVCKRHLRSRRYNRLPRNDQERGRSITDDSQLLDKVDTRGLKEYMKPCYWLQNQQVNRTGLSAHPVKPNRLVQAIGTHS